MANYIIERDRPGYLLIRDMGPWDQHRTITNDAESVVEELAPGLGDRKLFYIDTQGNTDRILHKDGKFIDFTFEQPEDA